MGVDLKVCPVRRGLTDRWWLLTNRLSLDRDYSLHQDIRLLQAVEVPESVKVDYYDDEGIRTITEDPYGDKLTYVMSDQFKRITRGDLSYWNRRVIDFLACIENTPVVLYWH